MLLLVFLALTWLALVVAGPSSYEPRIIRQLQPRKPEPEPAYPPTLETLRLSPIAGVFPRTFIDPTRTAEQKSKLTTAWNDAKLLVEAQTNVINGFDYDTPYRNWLGKDWNAKGGSNLEYQSKVIADKLDRLAELFRGEVENNDEFIWWCKDWGGNYNLEDDAGVIMLHDIYHYHAVSKGSLTALDYILTARDCFGSKTEHAYVNAESYTLCTLAIYLQQTFQTAASPGAEPLSHEADSNQNPGLISGLPPDTFPDSTPGLPQDLTPDSIPGLPPDAIPDSSSDPGLHPGSDSNSHSGSDLGPDLGPDLGSGREWAR
ncbi:Metalloproteases (zincins), catalytic [Glarea lozoyensis ATCC 20868]|uniref:Metalloproteases (Zincins), catalytic n=1 Tax=Glarea lozoyensis (strain ATCC 20868 / MF5171) TaxID=1116229 RepID=S3DWX1_GLAL2|nr:Metalloproteases (zincins), catalytic [Glarea lozoyensis ATCC 20868]EPE30868.1 Metalloproteases (zincins), catalytic [Glarea lozoyensis ATCC 20868]